jgi:uncharacterized damage-inducible protein DinB
MIRRQYHEDIVRQLKNYRLLAENGISQVPDNKFFQKLNEESNSIATIMKHMAGNMKSRWTDFLTTDGEKNRERDLEFEITEQDTHDSIWQFWEEGWEVTMQTISALKPDDFDKTIYIRKEPHTVLEAVNRQLTHYAYHVGQIILLAKYYSNEPWKSLSIPKGQSKDYEVAKDGIKYKNQ